MNRNTVFMMIYQILIRPASPIVALAILLGGLCGCGESRQYREITEDSDPASAIPSEAADDAPEVTAVDAEESLNGQAVADDEQEDDTTVESAGADILADASLASQIDSAVQPSDFQITVDDVPGDAAPATSQQPQSNAVAAVPPQDRSAELAQLRAQVGAGNKENSVREIKLLIPDKSFDKDSKTGALRVTYDDIDLLRILNMDPIRLDADKYMPEWLASLDGRQIVLKGFMYPGWREEGIQSFLFTRDNGTCCFGPNAKIYDKIGVNLKAGQTTNLIVGRPFEVVGTFAIEPQIEDDELNLLYHIQDAVVLDR